MPLKDYYKILGVSPAASGEELKKAYRKMAFRYHPDQNNGNRLSELQFREIKEAYDVLSDPRSRENYNYERFYQYQFLRRKAAPDPKLITPEWIVQQCRELSAAIASQDPFRIDRDAVLFHLRQILAAFNLEVLRHAADTTVNARVIEYCLQCTQPLTLAYTQLLAEPLLQLAGDNAALQQQIQNCIKNKKMQQWLNRYKLPAVILLAILLCLAILLATGSM